jgi:hypothetical protein
MSSYARKRQRKIFGSLQTPHRQRFTGTGQDRHTPTHPFILAHQKISPHANGAVAIAAALNTEGLKILAALAESLTLKYPAPHKK